MVHKLPSCCIITLWRSPKANAKLTRPGRSERLKNNTQIQIWTRKVHSACYHTVTGRSLYSPRASKRAFWVSRGYRISREHENESACVYIIATVAFSIQINNCVGRIPPANQFAPLVIRVKFKVRPSIFGVFLKLAVE